MINRELNMMNIDFEIIQDLRLIHGTNQGLES